MSESEFFLALLQLNQIANRGLKKIFTQGCVLRKGETFFVFKLNLKKVFLSEDGSQSTEAATAAVIEKISLVLANRNTKISEN